MSYFDQLFEVDALLEQKRRRQSELVRILLENRHDKAAWREMEKLAERIESLEALFDVVE